MNLRTSSLATLVSILLVSTPGLHAQSAPPVCPVPAAAPQATTRPAMARPTAEALEATAARDNADPTVLTAPEPPNFGIARYRLQDYDECVGSSGCYWADLDAQTERAKAELDRLLAVHHASTPAEARRQKLAIVLDIDETSLSSYCEEKREDYGYVRSLFEAWIVSPEASIPIPGTLRLYNHARAAGVSIFFLTGRPGKGTSDDQTGPTARNLAAAGYRDWQGLQLRDSTFPSGDAVSYKSAARAAILAQGYRILLNMGDQWSDLDGSPRGEISVKLPNPFYYLP